MKKNIIIVVTSLLAFIYTLNAETKYVHKGETTTLNSSECYTSWSGDTGITIDATGASCSVGSSTPGTYTVITKYVDNKGKVYEDKREEFTVVVFEVETETEDIIDNKSDRKKLGVAEIVKLNFYPNDNNINIKWSVDEGIIQEKTSKNARFIAPYNKSNSKISIHTGDKLLYSIEFTVVEPTGLAIKNFTDVSSVYIPEGETKVLASNQSGVYMKSVIEPLLPNDVSFSQIVFKEISGPTSLSDGCFKDAYHTANDCWLDASSNLNFDTAGFHGHIGPPWFYGAAIIEIPYNWKIKNSEENGSTFKTIEQSIVVLKEGKSTVLKYGNKLERTPVSE